MTGQLFETTEEPVVSLAPGAVLLRGLALRNDVALLAGVRQVVALAPLRRMVTPGGLQMSVAMTNCGSLGWVSDRSGYRYAPLDPASGRPWPPMPAAFAAVAAEAAGRAGFQGFAPDVCLVNRYGAGARLALHQDRDESDYAHPIVSVSLGLGAVFLFGGSKRSDRAARVRLEHGDVVVWGGPARLRYHGVLPLEDGMHPLTGAQRFNLTFRKAA
ncbi:MAG TPA: DNA oxidative demethylase AlkB [Burkholderiaceae bacterium]|nr:DNA oxidative demethylase AlkB [Burkholderiaceae bacterium]